MRHNLRESLNTENVHNRTKLIHDTIDNLRNIYDNTHFRESCLNDFYMNSILHLSLNLINKRTFHLIE